MHTATCKLWIKVRSNWLFRSRIAQEWLKNQTCSQKEIHYFSQIRLSLFDSIAKSLAILLLLRLFDACFVRGDKSGAACHLGQRPRSLKARPSMHLESEHRRQAAH